MIAKAHGVARLLQCDVLLPSENMQRADWCVEIFAAEQESMNRSIYAVNIERLVEPPSPPDE